MINIENKKIVSYDFADTDAWSCHIINGNFTLSVYSGKGHLITEIQPPINGVAYGLVAVVVDNGECIQTYEVEVYGIEGDIVQVEPQFIDFTNKGQFDEIYINSSLSGSLSYDADIKLDQTSFFSGLTTIRVTSNSDESYDYQPIDIKFGDKYLSTVWVSQQTDGDDEGDMFNVFPSSVNINNLSNTFTVYVKSYHLGKLTGFTSSIDSRLTQISKTPHSVTYQVNEGVEEDFTCTLKFEQNDTHETGDVEVVYTYISTDDVFGFGVDASNITEATSMSVTSLSELSKTFDVYSKQGEKFVPWYVSSYPDDLITVQTSLNKLFVHVYNPKETSGTQIILKNNHNKTIKVDLTIASGLINENQYHFGFNGDKDTNSITITSNTSNAFSILSQKGYSEDTMSPMSWTMKSMNTVVYDLYVNEDNNWVKSSALRGSGGSEVSISVYDSVEELEKGGASSSYVLIPHNLPKLTADTSYNIQFTQDGSYEKIVATITHLMFNKVTLMEVKIDKKSISSENIEASQQTLSFETIAVYKDVSGETYELNVSSQDQIKNNAKDYEWLSGHEKVSYIYSDGTLITPSTTSVSWSIDPNNNSYALEREVTAKYEGKQDVWSLIQANGDGGLTLPEEGKEEDDPITSTTEHYTFTVEPSRVSASGGDVHLNATLYTQTTVTDSDGKSETVTSDRVITNEVTWYCNGETFTPSDNKYQIGVNDSTSERDFEFTTQFDGVELSGSAVVTVMQDGTEEKEPVVETEEYYTFDVQPREVESSGGSVALSAMYYKNTTTDGEVSSESENVTTSVTWYCNNSQISSNNSYSIPKNENTDEPKTYTFTTSYGSVPLNQTETQIVVTQNTPLVYIHRVLHITHLTGNCIIKGYLRCQLDFTLDSGEGMTHNFDQGYEFGSGWQTIDKESFRLRNEMYEQKVTSIKLTAQDMVDVGAEPNETDNPYNPIKSIYFTVTLYKRDGSSSVEPFYMEWFGTNYEDGNFRSTLLEVTKTVSLSTPVRLLDISKIYVEVGYSHDPHEE